MDHEKIVLGAWLMGEHLDDMEILSRSDFYYFGQIAGEIMAGKNLLEIREKLQLKITVLTEMTSMYQPFMYSMALQIIIKNKIQKIVSKAEGPVDEMAEQINELAHACEMEVLPEPAEELAMNYIRELDERKKIKPVKYGLKTLDEIMGGIRKKELTTIGARPSVGKSAFLLQIALEAVSQNQKVLYFPLEMSTTQTVERIVQHTTPINQAHLRSGNLEPEEWQKISTISADTIEKIDKSGNFLIFEGCNNLTNIKRLIEIHKPFAVVIDQLTQLKDNKSFKDKREQFSYMTNELKRVSMESDVAVLLAAQINRSAQEEEPTMANLKESGSIEEDSDNVILLHRTPIEKVDEEYRHKFDDVIRPMKIIIAKQRSGGIGKINAILNAKMFQFYEA